MSGEKLFGSHFSTQNIGCSDSITSSNLRNEAPLSTELCVLPEVGPDPEYGRILRFSFGSRSAPGVKNLQKTGSGAGVTFQFRHYRSLCDHFLSKNCG